MLMQVGYSGSNVSVLYILFDDPNAEVNHRRKHKRLPGLDCQNWTPHLQNISEHFQRIVVHMFQLQFHGPSFL